MSVFKPHTEAVRKGKIAKPMEFGKLVTIQQAEHQIVTAFEVYAGATAPRLRPADDTHQLLLNRRLAVGVRRAS